MILRKLFKKPELRQEYVSREPGKLSAWLVGRLEHMERGMTRAQKMHGLAVFFIMGACCCALIVLRPFGKNTGVFEIGSKTVISPLPAYHEDGRANEWLLSHSRYLDSLKHDSAGLRIYNRMKAMRPGLIDSIEYAGRLLNDKN